MDASTNKPANSVAEAKLVLLQTAIGDYRQAVLEELSRVFGRGFLVLTGDCYFESSVRTNIRLDGNLRIIQNHYLLGRRLLWQSQMWRSVLGADMLLMEGNPRILSSWLILMLRKICRKPTAVWMHAWPKAGRESRSAIVRHLMRLLADKIVVYTEQQKRELKEAMPRAQIIAAPNALMRRSSMGVAPSPTPACDFIYVGRLVPAKKPLFCVRAFKEALPFLPQECRLLLLGAGPLERELDAFIAANRLQDRVLMMGHVFALDELRNHYSSALASVSPGYVGLSITQSFSFGVPMIISRNENHSPEIEAAQEGFNCQFFESDSIPALAEAFRDFFAERDAWNGRRHAIAESCALHYSVDTMAERLVEAFTVPR